MGKETSFNRKQQDARKNTRVKSRESKKVRLQRHKPMVTLQRMPSAKKLRQRATRIRNAGKKGRRGVDEEDVIMDDGLAAADDAGANGREAVAAVAAAAGAEGAADGEEGKPQAESALTAALKKLASK